MTWILDTATDSARDTAITLQCMLQNILASLKLSMLGTIYFRKTVESQHRIRMQDPLRPDCLRP